MTPCTSTLPAASCTPPTSAPDDDMAICWALGIILAAVIVGMVVNAIRR